MKGKKVGIGKIRTTTHALIEWGLVFSGDVVAGREERVTFVKGRDYIVPTFHNDDAEKGQRGCKDIIEAVVVVVDEFALLHVAEECESYRCVDEENEAGQFDDTHTFWQDINDWVNVSLAPRVSKQD